MKIVTLLPSATEIVCFLGLREQLVAVSHECDYPADVSSLPRITHSIIPAGLSSAEIDTAVVEAVHAELPLYHVNGDMLEELKPDLIITQGICDVCAVNMDSVQHTLVDLPDFITDNVQVISLSGTNFAGILRDIRLVAQATNNEAEADSKIAELQRQWHVLQNSQPSNTPTTLMLEWADPPFYGGHWVPEMVTLAGGIDLFGKDGFDSGRCTWAEIIEKNPDFIVVMACGYGLEANITFARELYQRPELAQLRAIQEQRIWACDANSYFSRPAPRIVDGAAILQAIFSEQVESMSGTQRVLATQIESSK